MAPQSLWQLCLCTLSAIRANGVLAAVLRDMSFNARQLGHLMPPGIALRYNLPAVGGEAAIAMSATGRQQIDHLIDTLRRRLKMGTDGG